jgi:hypothetical protein
VSEELAAADAGAALALDPLGPAFYAWPAGETAALAAHAAPLLATARGAGLERRPLGRARGRPRDRRRAVVPAATRTWSLLDLPDRSPVVDTGIALAPLRGAGLRAAGASGLRLAAAGPRLVGHPIGARRGRAVAISPRGRVARRVMRAAAGSRAATRSRWRSAPSRTTRRSPS